MDIYVVTSHFKESVQRLFPHSTVKLLPESPEGRENLSIDLLVFTGGSDINPQRYGMKAPADGVFNLHRDEIELQTMEDILERRLMPKKVLGICRGHQLLNVGFGGTLYYDFPSELGRNHTFVHSLSWQASGPLADIFPSVNSMHHQGICNVGDIFGYRILASEPNTGLIESVLWQNRFLGVQWHPELMDDSFRLPMEELMQSWVNGGNIINEENQKKYPGFSFSYKLST